jgi:PHS family inorganic phosphate transporter-like MFS transporter
MTNLESIDSMWRILIGLGCVPGVIALYFRLTIPETPRFTMDIERNINQASADIENMLDVNNNPPQEQDIIRIETPRGTWSDFRSHFSQHSNFQVLFGAAYSWFALDVSLLQFLDLHGYNTVFFV